MTATVSGIADPPTGAPTTEAPTTETPTTEAPTTGAPSADELADRLHALREMFGVPGAVVAVAHGDTLVQAASGVLSTATGLAVTTDSWFQIGSVTKLFTSSMAMQLVDEGVVDLTAPVRQYLPEFSVGDPEADAQITVGHLVSHTSGIQGDYFADFGRGNDAVQRFVASLPEVGMLHRPGQLFSYCNAGFCVLGRMLEVLRGKSFDEVLGGRLFGPLGISGGTTAEQAILHRSAVGHVPGADGGPPVPAPVWALPYSAGPAGSSPFMDAAGLVSFARMHIAGGVAADGTRVLSEDAVATMQRQRVSAPGTVVGRGVGVSWLLDSWGGGTIIGHNGGTLGQYSMLRVHPDSRTVTVLLTNGPGAIQLQRALVDPLLADLTGLTVPALPTPPAAPVELDMAPLAGRYRHHGIQVRVTISGNRAVLSQEPDEKQTLPDLPVESESHEFVPLRRDDEETQLIAVEQEDGAHAVAAFLLPGRDGRPEYLHTAGRAFRRVGS